MTNNDSQAKVGSSWRKAGVLACGLSLAVSAFSGFALLAQGSLLAQEMEAKPGMSDKPGSLKPDSLKPGAKSPEMKGEMEAMDGPSMKTPEAKAPGAKAAGGSDDLPARVKPATNKPGVRTAASDPVVQFINESLRQGWKDNDVEPSPMADDAEWIRRVYLDIVGRIPSAEEVQDFIADKSKTKRSELIEALLEDPGYVRNFTTIWTNLCIGQRTPRRVSRTGMQKFFREGFAKNRPWNEMVFDLVSAEGHFEKNGATNFILAQMQDNDDGVQLTAKTTRLFMGMQVQCTQCHNHPFNEWKQDQFWQFNSFFRQVRKMDHQKLDPRTGRQVDDYSEVLFRDFSGPVFFEKRSGLMQVAYPIYLGAEVDASEGVDRRTELAKLMTSGEKPLVATAYVNRMWGHFFGYGFTRPVDDMGPHNPPSNPALLDRLSDEFVKSGYDSRQLIRWIANAEAYSLTSRGIKKNERDNPAAGETPLFSHIYVKPMRAEQLYDSLIVATNAHKTGRAGWEQSEEQRQEWLQQFVQAFGTDDNEESSGFDGTIPQALMMMNGPLTRDAVALKPGSHLAEVLAGKGNERQKLNILYLSVLSRMPTAAEWARFQKYASSSGGNLIPVYQDMFWALLNSNEFIFIH